MITSVIESRDNVYINSVKIISVFFFLGVFLSSLHSQNQHNLSTDLYRLSVEPSVNLRYEISIGKKFGIFTAAAFERSKGFGDQIIGIDSILNFPVYESFDISEFNFRLGGAYYFNTQKYLTTGLYSTVFFDYINVFNIEEGHVYQFDTQSFGFGLSIGYKWSFGRFTLDPAMIMTFENNDSAIGGLNGPNSTLQLHIGYIFNAQPVENGRERSRRSGRRSR